AATANRATLTLGGPVARRLRALGVRVEAVAPARRRGVVITLPVRNLAPLGSDSAVVALGGALRLRAGGRRVVLRAPQTVVGPRSELSATVGSRQVVVLRVPAGRGRRALDATSGAVTLTRAPMVLTPAGARLLRAALRRPAIATGRVATVTLAADTTVTGMPGFASVEGPPTPGGVTLTPRPAGAASITAGVVRWSPRPSWLGYLAQGGGASGENGASFADGAFSLPISGGWYDRASGRAVVETAGTTHFQFLDHQIDVALSGWAFDLGTTPKATSAIDVALHAVILPGPSIVGTRQPLFFLGPQGLAPQLSADGASVAWNDVPVTLTNEGIALYLVYPYRSDQGQLSIAATLG
ncbi:HtaA domain-containing protein, partial [Conexibacter sp. CPCC 206217]|uniref:HtaA domain-containing protein n=1 Tax=Conexibacter sp. CPCC 206217 TaxID=3064574 RepID=UPI0027209624